MSIYFNFLNSNEISFIYIYTNKILFKIIQRTN